MNLSRPGWSGLSVVTFFLVFAAILAAFIGTLLLFPGKLLESLWRFNLEARAAFQSLGRLSSLLLFLVGAVAGRAAVGIRRRRKWGWWLAVLLFAVNACGDAVSLFVTGRVVQGVSGVVISGLFLLYLAQPRIRRQFSD
jgi:hypothetical protein